MEELWQSNRNIYIYTYNVFSHDEYIYIRKTHVIREIIKIAKTYKLLNNCNMYAHKTWNIYFTKIAIIWRRVDPDAIFAARYACMQCVKYSRSFPPVLFRNVRQTIETSTRIRRRMRRKDRIHSIYSTLDIQRRRQTMDSNAIPVEDSPSSTTGR